MDLGAYSQIGSLSKIAEEHYINVPRLRGYRLMGDEKPIEKEELDKLLIRAEFHEFEDGCESIPPFAVRAAGFEFSSRTRRLRKKYLVCDNNDNVVGFRWDLLHGKKRKNLKFAIKNRKKRIIKNIEVWNRYAGNLNVLYIHARIGGKNWAFYGGEELRKQDWFLEKVDDPWDNTYCDIYAKI